MHLVQVEPVDWFDRCAIDGRGELIGTVVDVLADANSGQPRWLAIGVGFFGRRLVVAPLATAQRLGPSAVIGHPAAVVLSGPTVRPISALALDQQRSVTNHYARHAGGSTERHPHP